jgi:hypothetical protein
LRTGEAARALELSETRVRQLGDEGVIEMQRTALGRLYSRASVLRYQAAPPRTRGRPARGMSRQR